MPFTAVVVDDEPLARDELKYLLSVYPECRVVGEAEDAQEALKLVAELQPDVVFLDIQMRGMSGCEAAREMLSFPHPPLVVFATAYNEYAVRAFELGAVDYLLKPFEDKRLAKTINRIEELRRRSGDWAEAVERVAGLLQAKRHRIKKLPVEKNGEIRLLDYQDIIFGRAKDGSVQIVTASDTCTYTGSMTELEARLKSEGFLRVHKSFLVNLNQVQGVLPWFKGTYWLVMGDPKKTQIPVSKSQVKELKSILGLEAS
ncbi:two component transcriptional regulator, LytTR family [Desulfofundulus kuznetsovii DSM 6115]|uniref:Stage 0 sporulation protein A homolog n=2 Tax=Desulfofundulus TaxID=2282741 RepID=A0A6N7IVF5_9FIRM|nr:LytTR family DNA-binding domain-containing protein [Desulfofundulus thermobenzoicus]AEG15788.1 two component transcriptional regulator, LytTR family [Desulfofundulus kuznetsovii DSM 6115]MQL53509.1 response regulator [Desulfofundulus thermobenzoicus]